LIRALVVDDEPHGRERVAMLLAGRSDVAVVGECADGRQAVRAIRELRPDLVFLDVQMPELDGFGVLEEVGPAEMPAVVFVTAYDAYAIRAFEVNALDYLLKPVDPERLATALERAAERVRLRAPGRADERVVALLEGLERRRRYASRFVVRDQGAAFFLPAEQVEWIEAERNYVRLHAKGGAAHLIREPLKEVEARLDPERFVRVSRSAIVNLDAVERVEPWFRGEYVLILRDGARLTSSRAHGESFRALMD
jgi:two-component system LytT family response regulator